MIDVREAGRLASRNPETVRRWIWSGRLSAQRKGRRLLVSRDDVLRLAGRQGESSRMGLAEWRAVARAHQRGDVQTASDLVLDDRWMRTDISP